MRTTLNIDDDLIAEAKILTVRRRTTLTAVIEAALREALAAPRREVVDLPVWHGGRQTGDFDLNDSSSVWELLDGERLPEAKTKRFADQPVAVRPSA